MQQAHAARHASLNWGAPRTGQRLPTDLSQLRWEAARPVSEGSLALHGPSRDLGDVGGGAKVFKSYFFGKGVVFHADRFIGGGI
jgi:hypothetical protein